MKNGQDVKKFGRLNYIEPTNFFENQEGTLSDSINFPYEDYNIAVDLTVSITDRYSCGWWPNDGGRKEFVYSSRNGTISFLGGTEIGKDKNYLTTNYTDISMTNPGANTSECLGIESISITYNSWMHPQVVIKFVDVRGGTVMLPAEKNYYNPNDKGNSSPIYKALFSFPYPMFTLKVKGLYGKGCTYRLAVENTNFEFDANTGNFNITVSFIGYMYGIYADIPMTFLSLAPYTKEGKKYWEEKKKKGEFVYYGINGEKGKPMMTIPELKLKLAQVANNQEAISAAAMGQMVVSNYEEQVGLLNSIYDSYPFSDFYVENNIGYKVFQTSGETLDFMEQKVVEYANLIKAYDDQYGGQYSNNMAQLGTILTAYKKTENGGRGSLSAYYETVRYFMSKDNINESKTFNVPYSSLSGLTGKYDTYIKNKPKVKEYIESNKKGSDFRVMIFSMKNIKFQTQKQLLKQISDDKKKIEAAKKENENHYKSKEGNIIEKVLGFRPSIKNIYNMMFAHMETFLHCFYTSTKKIKGQLEYAKVYRAKETFGVNNGDTDTEDSSIFKNHRGNFLPPYAAFYKTVTDTNGTRKVLRWPGEIKLKDKNYKLEEVSFVEHILGGAETYSEYSKVVESQIEAMSNSGGTKVDTTFSQGGAPSFDVSQFIPITYFDFAYKDKYGNPYKEIATKLYDGENAVEAEILTTFILRCFYFHSTVGSITGKVDGAKIDESILFGKFEAINVFKAVGDRYTNSFIKFLQKYADNGFISRFIRNVLFLRDLTNKGEGLGMADETEKMWVNNNPNLNDTLFATHKNDYFKYAYHKNGIKLSEDDLKNGYSGVLGKPYTMLPLFFKNFSELQDYYTTGKEMLSNEKMIPTNPDYYIYDGDESQVSTFFVYEARDYIKNLIASIKKEVIESEDEMEALGSGATYGNRTGKEYNKVKDIGPYIEVLEILYKYKFNDDAYSWAGPIVTADGTRVLSADVCKVVRDGSFDDQRNFYIKIPSVDMRPCEYELKYRDKVTVQDFHSIVENELYKIQTNIKSKAFLFLESTPIQGGLLKPFSNGIELKVKLLREGAYYWREDNPNDIITNDEILKKYVIPKANESFRGGRGVYLRTKEEITKHPYSKTFEYMVSNIEKQVSPSRRRVLKKFFEDWATSNDEYGFAANVGFLENINLYSRLLTKDGLDLAAHDVEKHTDHMNGYGDIVHYKVVTQTDVEKYFKSKNLDEKAFFRNDRSFARGLDIVYLANGEKQANLMEATRLQSFLRNLFFGVCTTIELYGPFYGNKTLTTAVPNLEASFKEFFTTLNKIYSKTLDEYKNNKAEFSKKMYEAEASNPFNTMDIKLSTYMSIKNLYDKWLCSPYHGPDGTWKLTGEKNGKTDFDSFKYVDTFYNDIGYSLMANVSKVSAWLSNCTPSSQLSDGETLGVVGNTLYEFLASVAQDCGGMLLALPQKFGMSSSNDVRDMFTPMSVNDNWAEDTSSFIFMYTYKPSEHLGDEETVDTDMNGWSPKGDGLSLDDSNLIGSLFQNGNKGYNVPAFAVTYAKQNQSIFKNIQLNSKSQGVTEAGIAATMNIASKSSESPRESTLYGQDLYKVMSNYSFNCSVETMGNTQIMPLMYFQLNNIPYWKGAYMIKKVQHNITAGNMTTNFEGVRINRYAIPTSDGAVAIHKVEEKPENTTPNGTTGGGSTGGSTGGVGGDNVNGNPNIKIADVIDFNESNISEMKPLICVTPAHGPNTNKKLEWAWSSKVVDKMVEILKGYKYKDGTAYNVQRCNKGGNHTGKGYSMVETKNLVNKYGSKKVVSLVPHWNGCGGSRWSALKGGKDDYTREDSIKLMECIASVAKEIKGNAKNLSIPTGGMNGGCYVELFPSRKKDDGTISNKSCDGATQQKCACALTENWFADYPKGSNWNGSGYNSLVDGKYKTMRGWMESDEGVKTIAELNAKGIKKYIDYINANGLVNVSGVNTTPSPQPNYEGKTLEEYIKSGEYVDITKLGGVSANIKVDIRYSTSNNIFKGNVYGDLKKAYLTKAFAQKVLKAQQALEEHNKKNGTKYTLLIWDAVRPNSIQIKAYKDPRTWPSGQYGKGSSIFGRPKDFTCPDGKKGSGSLHSFGTAVDLTIFDKAKNKELNMGTGFDSTDKAKSAAKASAQIIGQEAYNNRQLLFNVMKAGGLKPISNEWWHFQEGDNATGRANGKYVK